MAIRTWRGGTPGFETDVNTATNYVEGAVPVSTDDLRFADTSYSMTTSLSALSAVNLASMYVGQQFKGNIGDGSNPLQVNVTGTLTYNGRGQFASISGTIAESFIFPVSGQFSMAGGTWTNIYATGGAVYGAASAVLTNWYNQGAQSVLAPNATGVTLLINSAGSVDSSRSITTSRTNAGATSIRRGSAAVTTDDAYGTVRHLSSGTVTTLTVFSTGAYDPSGTALDHTVTNTTVHTGGSLVRNVPGQTITFTNPPSFKGVGSASQGPALPGV